MHANKENHVSFERMIGSYYEMTNESQGQRLEQPMVGSPMPDFSGPWPPVPDSFHGS